MAASVFSKPSLASKFRGCMIGGLVGDCLGCPFEFDSRVSKKDIQKYISKLMRAESTKTLLYTDDTAMSISVASSLVEKEQLDAKDMAQRFVADYFTPQPDRNYGTHVVHVFQTLRQEDFKDVFLPAKMQFNGEGSYGNGAAMRIAPIALFANSRGELYMRTAVIECSLITHAHKHGYNGAILICLAVNAALELDPSQELNPVDFISNLLEKMENVEKGDDKPHCESLKKMKEIFLEKQDISFEKVEKYFGNGETAQRSVSSSLYSFLRALKPLKDYEESNPFLRTMYFAICVKGDTDTIASMAGSIAGAYYGADIIPEVIYKRCEEIAQVIKLADKLFAISQKK